MKWYQKAADKELTSAQHDLGVMYENGLGVKQNYIEAIKWYRKASDKGYSASQKNLINLYKNNLGTPENNTEAFEWFLKSAMNQDIMAQSNKKQRKVKL